MTPSEELELRIFHFAESAGKANWRATNLPSLSNAVQFHEDAVMVDALMDLYARAFMEFRQWSNERTGWIAYAGGDRRYFYREFQMRVPFSGRNFERLEIGSKVLARPTLPQKPAPGTMERTATSQTRTKAPTAFVSHSTQDHPFVENFAADLRTNGVDVWFSKWEIKPGDSIRARIDEGLEGCEYFIIVLSKNSITRPWVQMELDAATIRKLNGKVRKIIPVKIEDCGDLPSTLASECWEDFSNQPYKAALKRVLDSIFDVDVRPPLGTPPSAAMQVGKRPAKSWSQVTTLPITKFPILMDELGAFAEQLRSEGFDARTDLFNGQGGLIVGPKGLDPNRMPPDEEVLFLPVWELNHESSRPLVDARRFHDMVENRPKDWAFNRRYPNRTKTGQPGGHWNRSASLLGSRDLERSIQQELTDRFPATAIPVNIDVVGDQGNTWAIVQINDFNAGIDERVKAVPEDFLGRGGLKAAIVTVAQDVIVRLQEAGQLPPTTEEDAEISARFESICPKCGNPTSHVFHPDKLRTLLANNELKLYCVRCDHHWKTGPEESMNVTRWLNSELP